MSDASTEPRPQRVSDPILSLAAAIIVVGLAGVIWSLTQSNLPEALGALATVVVGGLLYRWRWPRRRRTPKHRTWRWPPWRRTPSEPE